MIPFPAYRRQRVEADFGGGDISSNGGVGLLALAARRVGLLSSLARRLDDGRQAGKIRHELLPLLCERVFSVAPGYDDANDHDALLVQTLNHIFNEGLFILRLKMLDNIYIEYTVILVWQRVYRDIDCLKSNIFNH